MCSSSSRLCCFRTQSRSCPGRRAAVEAERYCSNWGIDICIASLCCWSLSVFTILSFTTLFIWQAVVVQGQQFIRWWHCKWLVVSKAVVLWASAKKESLINGNIYVTPRAEWQMLAALSLKPAHLLLHCQQIWTTQDYIAVKVLESECLRIPPIASTTDLADWFQIHKGRRTGPPDPV